MLLAAAVAVSFAPVTTPKQVEYRLYFPRLELHPDEQIVGFTVSVACGHIESVTAIPDDWNVDVARAVSEAETFHATAGHGAPYLRQLDPFNGSLHIRPSDRQCFDVHATVEATFDRERLIKLSRSQLQLRP